MSLKLFLCEIFQKKTPKLKKHLGVLVHRTHKVHRTAVRAIKLRSNDGTCIKG